MYGKYLKCHISQMMALIEVPFIPLLPALDELNDDIKFSCTTILPEVIKEIATASSMQMYFSTINNAKISLYISAK